MSLTSFVELLLKCIVENKLSKTSLFLLSKRKSILDIPSALLITESEEEDDMDDFELALPPWNVSGNVWAMSPLSPLKSGLNLSSEEWEKLRAKIDKAYNESLLADQAKTEKGNWIPSDSALRHAVGSPAKLYTVNRKLLNMIQILGHNRTKKNCFRRRKRNLPEKPDLKEEHCIVNVFHLLELFVDRLNLTDLFKVFMTGLVQWLKT